MKTPFKEMTLRNRTVREGDEIMLYLDKLTNEKVALLDELDNLKQSPSKSIDSFDEKYHIVPDVVAAGAKDLNIKKFNPDDNENPELTAKVSVDDESVKDQKQFRPRPDGQKPKAQISTTVVNVQNQEGKYNLNRNSLEGALKTTIAFLIYNKMIFNYQLVFFTDGARAIHDKIE
ncbi:MAG: hypothetical protein LBV23_09245, partial [Deltaproteobacteria bacterium]|nr:hypothetical protein [Deltaproteobacteria bacterium]